MNTRRVVGMGLRMHCALFAVISVNGCTINVNKDSSKEGTSGANSGGASSVTSPANSGGLSGVASGTGGAANTIVGGSKTAGTTAVQSTGGAVGTGAGGSAGSAVGGATTTGTTAVQSTGGAVGTGAGGSAGSTVGGATTAGTTNVAKGLVFSAAALAEQRTEVASSPRIAIDSSNNVMAVWVQSNGTASSIYANRYVPSAGWGTATVIETSDMPADNPQIAAGANGDFVAVWHQAWNTVNGTEYGIYSNRYVANVGWGTAATVYVDTSTESVSANGDIQVASDPNGNAVAVWSVYDWNWNHTSVRANRYVVGTGWIGVTNLSTEAVQSASGPDVAMNSLGQAFVVWEQATGTTKSAQGVHAVKFDTSTGWGTPALIESSSVSVTRSGSGPQVAFNSNGNAIAVWYQYGLAGIYSNQWSSSAGWGTPVAIADPGTTSYDEGVQLAIDANGNAMSLWNQTGGVLYADRFIASSGWGTAVVADPGSADYSGKVAFYPNGNALAVWGQYSRNSYNIWANHYTVGTGWGTTSWERSIVNSQTLDNASDPQLLIGGSGIPVVVWVQNGNIYSASASGP